MKSKKTQVVVGLVLVVAWGTAGMHRCWAEEGSSAETTPSMGLGSIIDERPHPKPSSEVREPRRRESMERRESSGPMKKAVEPGRKGAARSIKHGKSMSHRMSSGHSQGRGKSAQSKGTKKVRHDTKDASSR